MVRYSRGSRQRELSPKRLRRRSANVSRPRHFSAKMLTEAPLERLAMVRDDGRRLGG